MAHTQRTETLPAEIARTILEGFNKHYRLFRAISANAKERFEQAEWAAGREASRARIQMYDLRVAESVEALRRQFPSAGADEALWPQVKLAYIALLHNHLQPELAETFYNSVACNVLHRRYYNNEFIFWRPAVSTEHLEGDEPAYRCYYPANDGLRHTLLAIITSFRLENEFQDLRRDIRYLLRAFDEHLPHPWRPQPNFQIQVLCSLFYRNKAAHIVGRVINGNQEYPFVVPLLQDERRRLIVDTVLVQHEHISILFSFARAYFMVDMQVPSAYVSFLNSLLPYKPRAEIYTLLGLQKHGKTLFYRDLQYHLKHSSDQFVIAPGIKGMVMLVFTLPSFPYVFKMMRDVFAPPKETDKKTVKDKYLLVKYHDRVGRMADTLEYSLVALPLSRFDLKLVEELKSQAASNIEFEGENIIIKHMYIERRMVPLNLYLEYADETRRNEAVKEFGDAIKDLAGANIFPGDLLPKNFGVTRFGRVVFYDYDEICYMTDCSFRRMPKPRSMDEEMAAEPWYTVEPNDIFPEQFATFLFTNDRTRDAFLRYHADLTHAEYWAGIQQRIVAGVQPDVFPYPEAIRFCNRYGASPAGMETPPAERATAAIQR